MYKIPDDSVIEEEVPVKSYFKSKNTATLDETVRNHGRCDATTSKTSVSDTTFSKTSASTASSAPVSADNAQEKQCLTDSHVTKHVNVNQESHVNSHAPKVAPKSLSDAFSFIKETEFYDEKDAEKAAEQNRKRKIEERGSTSDKQQVEQKQQQQQQQSSSAAVIVSTRQRGNPLLPHLRNVVITYRDDILPDYILGANTCAIFLSLKYHRLHPDYIYERLRQLGKGYTVRVLLILVDIPDSAACIQELTKVALLSSLTLMLAWSPVEAARYLEAFKIYENKPPEVLQGIKNTSYQGHLNGFLTSIRGVNKTDVARLKSEFGTVKDIISADKVQLSALPGIGDKKAERIYDLLRKPFKTFDKT